MTNFKQYIAGAAAFSLSLLPTAALAEEDVAELRIVTSVDEGDFQPPVSNAIAGLCAVASVIDADMDGGKVEDLFTECQKTLPRRAHLIAVVKATEGAYRITNETKDQLSVTVDMAGLTGGDRLEQRVNLSYKDGQRTLKTTTLYTDPETKRTHVGSSEMRESDDGTTITETLRGEMPLCLGSNMTNTLTSTELYRANNLAVRESLNIKGKIYNGKIYSWIMAADTVFTTGKGPNLWGQLKGKWMDTFGVHGEGHPDTFNVNPYKTYTRGQGASPYTHTLGKQQSTLSY